MHLIQIVLEIEVLTAFNDAAHYHNQKWAVLLSVQPAERNWTLTRKSTLLAKMSTLQVKKMPLSSSKPWPFQGRNLSLSSINHPRSPT